MWTINYTKNKNTIWIIYINRQHLSDKTNICQLNKAKEKKSKKITDKNKSQKQKDLSTVKHNNKIKLCNN